MSNSIVICCCGGLVVSRYFFFVLLFVLIIQFYYYFIIIIERENNILFITLEKIIFDSTMDGELNNSDPNVDSVDFTNADEFDNPDVDDDEGETITSKKVSIYIFCKFYILITLLL